MDQNKIVVSGTGCALADYLYNGISFIDTSFTKYLSQKPGDGGLLPGQLVFTEELEKFTGKKVDEILKEVIGTRKPDLINIGGPALVSMIHASQMLDGQYFNIMFFGIAGTDQVANHLLKLVHKVPLNVRNYTSTTIKNSPFTLVLSDPEYSNGQGERAFINNIGAAWHYFPEQLSSEFWESHIVCFGGTALVPHIHDKLSQLICKAKQNNCLTVVNTVFDFRSEKANPDKPWPLVDKTEDYAFIDILIMSSLEAMRISGEHSIEAAANYFSATKVGSFIITDGASRIFAWSSGRLFRKNEVFSLPVSEYISDHLRSGVMPKGDTTGCGDNFAGGIVASMAIQLKENHSEFDLLEAISWGVAAGGFTCFTIGGTFFEQFRGEKKASVSEIQQAYIQQIQSEWMILR